MDNNTIYEQQTAMAQPEQQVVHTQGVYNGSGQVFTPEVKCPGKEISGRVFGINALVWGILALILAWIPFYGLFFGGIYGAFGIVFAIVTFVLSNKVFEQATVITNKIKNGKKLAKAGLIISIIAVCLSIAFTVLWITLFISLSGYSGNDFFDAFRNTPIDEILNDVRYY